jgi:hypothetical protein
VLTTFNHVFSFIAPHRLLKNARLRRSLHPSPFNVFRGHVPIPLGLGTPCGKVSPHVPDASRLGDFGGLASGCFRTAWINDFFNWLLIGSQRFSPPGPHTPLRTVPPLPSAGTFANVFPLTGFTSRGLSPHKFTPEPGVHNGLQATAYSLRCASAFSRV